MTMKCKRCECELPRESILGFHSKKSFLYQEVCPDCYAKALLAEEVETYTAKDHCAPRGPTGLRRSWAPLVVFAILLFLISVVIQTGRLNNSALVSLANVAQVFQGVVGLLTLAPIVWAVVCYRQVAENQRKAKHYQAWQAISHAQGKPGSGGRIDALQDLARDGVSLDGVDLSGRTPDANGGAYLAGLQLPGASLRRANFPGAGLDDANLSGAILWWADFSHAVLFRANLAGADLEGANLSSAFLWEANLSGAELKDASLSGAKLRKANLSCASLWQADLSGADLKEADLTGAYNAAREQILSAMDWRGAKLPSDMKDLELGVDVGEQEMINLGRTLCDQAK